MKLSMNVSESKTLREKLKNKKVKESKLNSISEMKTITKKLLWQPQAILVAHSYHRP